MNQMLPNKIRWIFGIFLFFDLINLLYFIIFFKQHHYLPAPFFVRSDDTFMDFYNPLFHALKGDFYNTYRSLFPPINVFILKFFGSGINIESYSSPFELRHANSLLTIIVCIFYIAIIALVINIGEWKKFKLSDRFLMFLAIIFSTPVIFSLERGNLIFLALAFIALSYNSVNKWKKALYIGLAVNVKPYILVTFFRYCKFSKVNKKIIFINLLFCGIIFFTIGLFTDINYVSYFKGYFFHDYFIGLTNEGATALPHNIPSLLYIKHFVPFDYFSYYFWFSLLKVISLLAVIFLVYLSLHKDVNTTESMMASLLVLTNFSVNTGGYSLLYLLLMIPYLINLKEYNFMLFLILSIFALPFDLINIFSISVEREYSYLAGTPIPTGVYWFTLGTFVRPLINYLLLLVFIKHLIKKYHFRFFSFSK